MASIIDREEGEYIQGLTSEQARDKVNTPDAYWAAHNARSSDENVYDVEVPIRAMYKVPVWARSEADAIRTVERFVDREFPYALDQIDICCGYIPKDTVVFE